MRLYASFACVGVADDAGGRRCMGPATATRTTTALLHGLQDPHNEAAWTALVERCAPIMRGVAIRMGLDGDDAEDLVQTALVTFVESWRRGQYDRSRGRLSSYLVTILRSRITEWRRGLARRAARAPTTRLESRSDAPAAPDDAALEQLWAVERQQQILVTALATLRANGPDDRWVTAFELYAIGGADPSHVAAQLGMTREDVYNAKYRITRRLQSIVARLDELYEDL